MRPHTRNDEGGGSEERGGGVEEGGRNEEVLGGGKLTGGRLCFCLMAVGSPAFFFVLPPRQGVDMKE